MGEESVNVKSIGIDIESSVARTSPVVSIIKVEKKLYFVIAACTTSPLEIRDAAHFRTC